MSLGSLSEKYESNGDPGCVSTGYGDLGGISYGKWQLASNTGSVQRFVNWLEDQGHACARILSQHQPGSLAFSTAWKFCANEFDDFGDMQHDYIQYAYYEPAVAALRQAGFNIENHHAVMQDVIWSRAVQYGTGYIVEMFEEACALLGHPNLSYVDASEFDAQMIEAIYLHVCRTPEWTDGSPDVRPGLYNRFENECRDALARLG